METILGTIRSMLDLDPEGTDFNTTIIPLINGTFSRLKLLGVEIPVGFRVDQNGTKTWLDMLGQEQYDTLEEIPTFICLKVRLAFDPPQNSFLVEGIKELISQIEFNTTMIVGG